MAAEPLQKLISPFVDDELSAADRALVQAELDRDPRAALRVADLQALRGAMHGALEARADEVDFTGFEARVMAGIAAEAAKSQPSAMTRLRLWWAETMAYQGRVVWAAFSGAAVAAGVMFVVMRPTPGALGNGLPEGVTLSPQAISLPQGLVVHSIQTRDSRVQPVVLRNDDGSSVVLLIDAADDEPGGAAVLPAEQQGKPLMGEQPKGGEL